MSCSSEGKICPFREPGSSAAADCDGCSYPNEDTCRDCSVRLAAEKADFEQTLCIEDKCALWNGERCGLSGRGVL